MEVGKETVHYNPFSSHGTQEHPARHPRRSGSRIPHRRKKLYPPSALLLCKGEDLLVTDEDKRPSSLICSGSPELASARLRGRITNQGPWIGQGSTDWRQTPPAALSETEALVFLSGPGPGGDLPRKRSPSHSHHQKAEASFLARQPSGAQRWALGTD